MGGGFCALVGLDLLPVAHAVPSGTGRVAQARGFPNGIHIFRRNYIRHRVRNDGVGCTGSRESGTRNTGTGNTGNTGTGKHRAGEPD